MDVDSWDSDATLEAWNNRYNVDYDGCGRDGGARTITSMFGISGTPSYRIIAPDKTILASGNFYSSTVETKMVNDGLQEHVCDSPTVVEENSMYVHSADGISVNLTNAGNLQLTVNTGGQYAINMYNASGILINAIPKAFMTEGAHDVALNSSRMAKGVIFVEVISDKQGIRKKVILY